MTVKEAQDLVGAITHAIKSANKNADYPRVKRLQFKRKEVKRKILMVLNKSDENLANN